MSWRFTEKETCWCGWESKLETNEPHNKYADEHVKRFHRREMLKGDTPVEIEYCVDNKTFRRVKYKEVKEGGLRGLVSKLVCG